MKYIPDPINGYIFGKTWCGFDVCDEPDFEQINKFEYYLFEHHDQCLTIFKNHSFGIVWDKLDEINNL